MAKSIPHPKTKVVHSTWVEADWRMLLLKFVLVERMVFDNCGYLTLIVETIADR